MRLTFFSREQRENAVFESREKQIFARYKLGSWVKGYAWLPVRIDPKTVVWLESYQYRLIGTDRRKLLLSNGQTMLRVVPVFEYRPDLGE